MQRTLLFAATKLNPDPSRKTSRGRLPNTELIKREKYCDGVNLPLSFPLLKNNQCERSYVAMKETCESSYVATYKGNKVNETLCGYVSTVANIYFFTRFLEGADGVR